MFARIKSWLFSIRLHQVVLALIVLLGLWLRLSCLSQTMWLYSGMDEARDILVVKHIVEYHDTIIRGPFAAGGYFWLENSPFYYYLIAAIWFIGRGALASDVIWVMLSCSGILLSYWAGTLTRNKILGLLAALLYAVHPSLIMVGTQIMQPHVLPLCSLWFYCSLLTGWKEKSGWWLLVAGFWLLIPIHFHYAGLLMWPVGGLAVILSWYFAQRQQWRNWQVYLLFSAGISLNIALFWLALTFKYRIFDQFYFFTLNKGELAEPFLHRLSQAVLRFKTMTLGAVPNQQAAVFAASMLIGWMIIRKRFAELFAVALALSVCFSLIFKSYLAETYMLSLLPFWILLWAGLVQSSFKLRWWLGISLVLLTCWWWPHSTAAMRRDWPAQNFYAHHQEGAKAIQQDYLTQVPEHTNQVLPRFTVAGLTSYTGFPYDGWIVGPFWFFLENMMDQKLVKLTDFDTNFYPLTERIDFVYFVCDTRDQAEKADVMCYQAFTKKRDYLDAGTTIYTSDMLKIWRFSVEQSKKPKQIYRTYPEYM